MITTKEALEHATFSSQLKRNKEQYGKHAYCC